MYMKNKKTLLVFLIIAIHSFILTKLLFYPYTELFIYPYLTNMGLLPYSQILDQHFPGLMFLPINFNNLGLINEDVARLWSIGIVSAIHLLIYFIAKRVFNFKIALLSNVLFLIWHPFLEGWVLWIDSFMPLLLLPAFYFTRERKLLLSGIFFGLAILFKQTVAPLVILIFLFSLWELRNWRKITPFVIGIIPIPMLMVLYYWVIGVFGDFWFWTVTFNLTTYKSTGTHGLPLVNLTRVLGIFSPVVLCLFKPNRDTVLLSLFFVGSLAGVFDRADFVHFQPALPFGLILIAYAFINFHTKIWVKGLAIIYLLLILWWLRIFYLGHLSNHVINFEPQTKLVAEKIKLLSTPKEEIFIFGAPPHLYQMSHTIPAGRVFVFQFPWFFTHSQDRLLDALESSKPRLIVRNKLTETDRQKLIDFGSKLNSYIDSNYYMIDKIGDDEFLIRNGQ